MRLGFSLILLVGALSGVLLLSWNGLAAVGQALQLAGWSGLALMSLYHLLPLALCALAWRAITPGSRPAVGAFIWFRWLRDAGSDILGMVPAAGEMLGIRAMSARRVDASLATATTVVDLTMEMCGQLVFTLLGLAVLVVNRPGDPLIVWTAIGGAALGGLFAAFVAAQHLGLMRLLERLARHVAGASGTDLVQDRIRSIYADRAALLRAASIHTVAWVVGIGEAGIALWLMGVPVGIGALLVLESITFALRSAAFFVPAAAGVQEGSYVLLGAALGIGPEFALALSLLKRGRELVLGIVALFVWHALEGRGLWRRVKRAERV